VHPQVARLLNHVTWTPLLACEHPALISGAGPVIAYKEVEELHNVGSKAAREMRSKYSICSLPVAAPSQQPPLQKPNPSLGVGAFSGWCSATQHTASELVCMCAVACGGLHTSKHVRVLCSCRVPHHAHAALRCLLSSCTPSMLGIASATL
jgi:hypothetical protein